MNDIVPLLIVLALIGGGGAALYFLVIKKKAAATVPPVTGWQFQYSTSVSGTPEDFDFPASDGVHYCVKTPPPAGDRKDGNLNFTLSGTGTLVPVQGTYPYVILYIQRAGDNMSGAGDYQQYRYFMLASP